VDVRKALGRRRKLGTNIPCSDDIIEKGGKEASAGVCTLEGSNKKLTTIPLKHQEVFPLSVSVVVVVCRPETLCRPRRVNGLWPMVNADCAA
jgi:hypothetical protein